MASHQREISVLRDIDSMLAYNKSFLANLFADNPGIENEIISHLQDMLAAATKLQEQNAEILYRYDFQPSNVIRLADHQ